MLSGPETTRLLHQFEGQYLEHSDEHGGRLNHEMGLSAQKNVQEAGEKSSRCHEKDGKPFPGRLP